jgi:hypothetical protein
MVNRGEFVVKTWLRDDGFIGLNNGTGFWDLFCDSDRKSDWKAALGITKTNKRNDKYRDPSLRSRMTTKTEATAGAATTTQRQRQIRGSFASL